MGTAMISRLVQPATERSRSRPAGAAPATTASMPPTPNSQVRARVEKYARLWSWIVRARQCAKDAAVTTPSTTNVVRALDRPDRRAYQRARMSRSGQTR